MEKLWEFFNCIASALQQIVQDEIVVVTVLSSTEGMGIWSEAELEAKDAFEWIEELSKSCMINLIHLSAGNNRKVWQLL